MPPKRSTSSYIPAAMVGHFDEVADAVRTGEVDPDVLVQSALRYSMEVIGPVPDGYV